MNIDNIKQAKRMIKQSYIYNNKHLVNIVLNDLEYSYEVFLNKLIINEISFDVPAIINLSNDVTNFINNMTHNKKNINKRSK